VFGHINDISIKMSEPIEMSKARNAYAKERDHFRRELQWALRLYDNATITFDIKQQLRFKASDIKAQCIEAYREATKNIGNNQAPLVGTNLRIRRMANSEEACNVRERSKSPRLIEDDEDVEAFIARNRASKTTDPSFPSSRFEPSIPLTKMTYNAHKAASTNTHVLSFERQLREDIDRMIGAIENLTDENRSTWLTVPKSDSSQYFSSRYDDTSFSTLTYTPIGVNVFPSSSSNISSTLSSNGFERSKARSYFDRYLQKY